MGAVEERLYNASLYGRNDEVRELLLLRGSHTLDVNWRNTGRNDEAGLHVACAGGHLLIVSLILASPRVDVNLRDRDGLTPLLHACKNGSTGVARLLLADSRVNASVSDQHNRTALWWSAWGCDTKTVEYLIASGKVLNVHLAGCLTFVLQEYEPSEGDVEGDYTALEIARECGYDDIVNLLERLVDNPVRMTEEVRRRILWCRLSVLLFATSVFLSEGVFSLKSNLPEETVASRFFTIASRLPSELQLALCRRVYGFESTTAIPDWERKNAFKIITNVANRRDPIVTPLQRETWMSRLGHDFPFIATFWFLFGFTKILLPVLLAYCLWSWLSAAQWS